MEKMQPDNDIDLAIIGYSQAGKTTLAVGLYATSTEGFTVIGDGEDTENYLRSRKALLETGHWPDATQERDSPELCLKLIRPNTDTIRVRFKEYMGELATNSENYKRDIIGRPKVALILLNPRMDILADPIRRVEMLSQLREIVFYLAADDVGCEYVALVTTASDILETKDETFRETFQGYKSEIVNVLKASRFERDHAWKEFSVSVSGKLESQDCPRIARGAENTSRAPFEWAISKIEEKQKQVRRRRAAVLCSIAACVLGILSVAAFCEWYFHLDRAAERSLLAAVSKSSSELNSVIEKKEVADILTKCKKIEEAVNASSNSVPFFSGNADRLEDVRSNVLMCAEKGRMAWCPLRFAQMEKTAEREASEENCNKWRKDIEDWHPVSDAGIKLRSKCLKAFGDAVQKWRTQYECRTYKEKIEVLTKDIVAYDVGKDEKGSEVRKLLIRCRKVELGAATDNALPLVPWPTRKDCCAIIVAQRTNLLGRVIVCRLASLKTDGADCPALSDEDRNYFSTFVAGDEVLSVEDRMTFFAQLDLEVAARKKAWEEFQRSECENAIREIVAKESYDAVRFFGDFYAYHPNAPQLNKVVLALHDKVGAAMLELVIGAKEGKGTAQSYGDTIVLCNAISKIKCPAMKMSCWFKFANDCLTFGDMGSVSNAFPQIYRVERIDMKYSARSLAYASGQTFNVQFCFSSRSNGTDGYVNVGKVNELSLSASKGYHDWGTIWTGSFEQKANVWPPLTFTIKGMTDEVDCKHRILCIPSFTDGKEHEMGGQHYIDYNVFMDNTDMDVNFRVVMTCEGKGIWDYLPTDTKLELP